MRENRRKKSRTGKKRNWKRKIREWNKEGSMVTNEWGVSFIAKNENYDFLRLPSPVFLNVHVALFLLCTLSTLEKYGKLMNACRTM